VARLVEIFFGIITRQAIRRGTFTSVKDLITAIETFIDGTNAANPSSGPRPQTKSSPKPTARRLQTRDTSGVLRSCSAGLPAIASTRSGSTDLIENGRDGSIVEAGSMAL
jgi:hypothetical protein